MAIRECESSVMLPITKDIYQKFINIGDRVHVHNIMYFDNNVRKTVIEKDNRFREIFQRKNTLKSTRVLKIKEFDSDFYFIPLTRTQSTETPMPVPLNSKPHTLINRTIMYYFKDKRSVTRMAVEIASSNNGVNYRFTSEIEYEEKQWNSHRNLEYFENKLLNDIYCRYGQIFKQIDIFSCFEHIYEYNMPEVPSRKFSPMSDRHLTENLKAKRKYDGFKGRCVCTKENYIIMYDDLQQYFTVFTKFFNKYPRILFQYEMMSPSVDMITLSSYANCLNSGKLNGIRNAVFATLLMFGCTLLNFQRGSSVHMIFECLKCVTVQNIKKILQQTTINGVEHVTVKIINGKKIPINMRIRSYSCRKYIVQLNCLLDELKIYDGTVIDSELTYAQIESEFETMSNESKTNVIVNLNAIFVANQFNKTIILTDVLGVYIKKKIYMPEPLEVLDFLKFIKIDNYDLKLPGIGVFELRTQCDVKMGDASNRDDQTIDGFILVSGNREMKLKIPTIDVVYKEANKRFYLSDQELSIVNREYVNYIDGAIYEICPANKDDITVIRRRYDRFFPATLEDFEKYNKELQFLKKCQNVSLIL